MTPGQGQRYNFLGHQSQDVHGQLSIFYSCQPSKSQTRLSSISYCQFQILSVNLYFSMHCLLSGVMKFRKNLKAVIYHCTHYIHLQHSEITFMITLHKLLAFYQIWAQESFPTPMKNMERFFIFDLSFLCISCFL